MNCSLETKKREEYASHHFINQKHQFACLFDAFNWGVILSLSHLFFSLSLQSYTTNSAKVVFLNQRPQTRNIRGSGNFCNTCDRSLQDPYQFCSLSCKVLSFSYNIHTHNPNINNQNTPSMFFSNFCSFKLSQHSHSRPSPFCSVNFSSFFFLF